MFADRPLTALGTNPERSTTSGVARRIHRAHSLAMRTAVLALAALGCYGTLCGQEPASQSLVAAPRETGDAASATRLETTFAEQVQPLLAKYCLRCHNADTMKSGIRVDYLNAALEDRHLRLWKEIQGQITEGAMPPEDEPQPTSAERQLLGQWIGEALHVAKTRVQPKNGSVRRLTVSQYRNTLRDLLGLEEDLTEVLPPDSVSQDGFANNAQAMVLSPLQVESYLDIAEQALDRCLVDETARPVIQNFRVDLGKAINPDPYPDALVLGADSLLLDNADFAVHELMPSKPFVYQPFFMRTSYDFIEGYQGNDTVRGWRKFNSIYHSVFACLRGTRGYPKGEPYQAIPGGLLLRPAIPSSELFGSASTYGPMANFKISLRELPDHGDFRVTVRAARYDDGLLLDAGTLTAASPPAIAMAASDQLASPAPTITIDTAGIYQLDVHYLPKTPAEGEPRDVLRLELGDRHFSGELHASQTSVPAPDGDPVGEDLSPDRTRGPDDGSATGDDARPDDDAGTDNDGRPGEPRAVAAFLLVRLPAGPLRVSATYGDNTRLRKLTFSRVAADSQAGLRFLTFERRVPLLGVHLGLRRDCGSTLTRVGEPRSVSNRNVQEFVFHGAINNFPSPDVEPDNVNYLAGVREIGVRNEYTDGRDMPRLLVSSVEFEGPFYAAWPPKTHRDIFIESPDREEEPAAYARQVIREFATRAFRRPITVEEEADLLDVWESSVRDSGDAGTGIRDALLVVLTSPQFLFLIENSQSPAGEDLDPFELAAKLSYFLWNSPPDEQLLACARANTLQACLDSEIDRMIRDARFHQFVHEFASQWFRLDKFDVVEVDANRYPKLTRDTKTQLRNEPVHFLRYLIERNLPLRNLIHSDFLVVNDVVASYYDLADRCETGFHFIPIQHQNANLGGVLSQASILAGLSDGRESNPVKRGAWLARKVIAEPPDDPPPNVPQLPEDDESHRTLREKLERHRNQEGCAKCHAGIDPWGLPFEQFDAGGLFKSGSVVDARSTLPDGTEIADYQALRAYLSGPKLDQVAFSFLKHLASYAIGRSLTYSELVFLQERATEWNTADFPLQDMIRFVIKSDLFLKK